MLMPLLCVALTAGQEAPSEFSAPWANPAMAIVIDPYELNPIDWDLLADDKRVVGIIHKASQGLRTDKRYLDRKEEALKRGYLWGSYHLLTSGDAVEQAKHYLEVTNPGPDELLALDLEVIDGKTLTLEKAQEFIEHIVQETQRYPLLYVNHATALTVAKAGEDSVFAKCPLWYARFKKEVKDFPKGLWTSYTLWQFSCEINSADRLYEVPGTKSDMDVNVYFGTPEELKSNWPLTRIFADPPEAHKDE